MKNDSLEQLYLLAAKFRSAIECSDRRVMFRSFKDFPKGSCAEAAVLLGIYLEDQGFGVFNKMRSFRYEPPPWISHAWLQRGNLVIDITADQFPEIKKKIIVAVNSVWHRTFPNPQTSNYRSIFEDEDGLTDEREKYVSNYRHILSFIE